MSIQRGLLSYSMGWGLRVVAVAVFTVSFLVGGALGQNRVPQIVGHAGASSGDFGLRVATRQPGYPVPHVQGPTVPQSVAPGGPDFTLSVYGANFILGSVVNWDHAPRATLYVSAHELQATILASDIAIPTAGMITVTTTSPNGPLTSSTYFQVEVHDPMPTMSPTSESIYNGFVGFQNGIADFNNDNFLDLAGASGGFGYSTITSDLMNQGNGTFGTGWSLTDKQFPFGLGGVFGDFNNDGNIDYMYMPGRWNQESPSPLAVSFGNGNGTFTPGPTFGYFGNQFGPTVPDFVVGDFNQDGTLDVLATQIGNRIIELFLGNGDGTFTQSGTTYTGNNFNFVIGDFNGDGKLDLLARSQEYASDTREQYALDIFFGNGDGTFQPPKRIAVIPVPIDDLLAPSYVVSDFNKDGNLDIAFANYEGKIGILLGNGDGTFRPPTYYTVGEQYWFAFATGDFTSDGNTDIIVQQNTISTEFSILLGNGDGTFQKPRTVNAGGYPGTILTVADFNNDGMLDFSNIGIDYHVYLQRPGGGSATKSH